VAITSNRLNQVIKALTVIATILLPLTVVTGYYGMNFKMPEYEWLRVGSSTTGAGRDHRGLTWWYIKRRRWL
jgi:magnesium transporter